MVDQSSRKPTHFIFHHNHHIRRPLIQEKWTLPPYLFLVFLVLAILTVLGGMLFYRHFEEITKSRVEAMVESVSRHEVGQVTEWRNSWVESVTFISRGPFRDEVTRYLAHPAPGALEEELEVWFQTIRRRKDVKGVVLLDPDGKKIFPRGEGLEEVHPPDPNTLREVRETGSAVFSLLHSGQGAHDKELDLLAPIHGRYQNNVRTLAILMVTLDPGRELFPSLKQWPIPTTTGRSFLIRRDGDSLVFLDDRPRLKIDALQTRLPLREENNVFVLAALGLDGVQEGRDLDGHSVLAAIHRVPQSDWLMITKIDRWEAYDEMRQFSRIVMAGVSLLVLLTGAIISTLWRHQRVKELKEAYEAERERAALIEATPDIVAMVDSTKKYQWLNKVGMDFFGPEALGKDMSLFLDEPPNPRTAKENIDSLFEGLMENVRAEVWQLRADGERRLISWSCRPLRDESGRVNGVLSIGHDITDRKRMVEALERSEHLYRSLVNNAPVGIFRTTPDGRFLAVNSTYVKMLGYDSEEEMMSLDVARDIYWNSSDRTRLIETLQTNGEVVDSELTLKRKDGTPIMIKFNIRAVKHASGAVESLEGVIEDITVHKKLERELAESEEKYRHLVNKSLVGVYLFQGRLFQFVNPKMAEIFGYRLEELVGKKSILDLTYPEDRAWVAEKIEQCLTGSNPPTAYAFRGNRKDGSIIDIEVLETKTLYRGHPAIQGTLMDVSERKNLQAQLVQAQKMESLGTLAGGIAHDFNNILTGILGFTEIALTKLRFDDVARPSLMRVQNLGERAVELTKNILLFGRKQKPIVQEVELSKTIQEFVPFLRRLVEENIEIKTLAELNLPPVNVDPTQLHQLLMNLCVNARDAMPHGGTMTINAEVARIHKESIHTGSPKHPGSFVVLSVADTGCGMDPETVKRIFDPFFTTKEAGKGTGLGLAVCFGIAREHEGWIEVETAVNRGSTFRVFFPVQTPTEERKRFELNEVAAPRGNGECVLVVDDEAQLCELARAILEQYNYTVLNAVNGEEALELYRKESERVDLLVTDVVMPKMGGAELARKIRTVNPRLPVLFCSGYRLNLGEGEFPSGDYSALIDKPYSPHQLVQKVHQLLHLP